MPMFVRAMTSSRCLAALGAACLAAPVPAAFSFQDDAPPPPPTRLMSEAPDSPDAAGSESRTTTAGETFTSR